VERTSRVPPLFHVCDGVGWDYDHERYTKTGKRLAEEYTTAFFEILEGVKSYLENTVECWLRPPPDLSMGLMNNVS